MAATVSVIICAHTVDRIDDIRRAVDSVLAQSHPPNELLVVVDHNEELVALVAELLTELGARVTIDVTTEVIAGEGPKGLSTARNTGVSAAIGEVVAFLDDDAVAAPGWLATLVAPFDDPAVVAVGGRATPRWDTARPSWFPREFDWVIGCSHRGLPVDKGEVRNVIGCTMAFRRRAVLDAGGFDVGLGRRANRPSGCEETELCVRLKQLDPTRIVLYEPGAEIEHRVRAARGTVGYYLRRCRAEGASKAHVARSVGSSDGLQSERDYLTRVLPLALLRAVALLPRAPIANLGLILAIVGGLLATGGGYLQNSIRHRV